MIPQRPSDEGQGEMPVPRKIKGRIKKIKNNSC